MSDPVEDGQGVMQFMPARRYGAVNHNHRQAERARCFDLGIGASAARILGDDEFDAELLHQGAVGSHIEGSAINDHFGIGKGQRPFRRINKTQQIQMLRIGREVVQMHTSDRQHHARGRTVQRAHGSGHVVNVNPGIIGQLFPRRSRQSNKRNAGFSTGCHRVAAHLHGERVGRIDHMADAFGAQISDQPSNTAESAHPLGQGLAQGAFYPPCERHGAVQPFLCRDPRESRRFGRSRKDEEFACHG